MVDWKSIPICWNIETQKWDRRIQQKEITRKHETRRQLQIRSEFSILHRFKPINKKKFYNISTKIESVCTAVTRDNGQCSLFNQHIKCELKRENEKKLESDKRSIIRWKTYQSIWQSNCHRDRMDIWRFRFQFQVQNRVISSYLPL